MNSWRTFQRNLFFLVFLFLCMSRTSAQQESIGEKKIEMMKNGTTLTVPYYSNLLIEVGSDDIKNAVIVVHGVNRNADDYFNNMSGAADLENGVSAKTIIIAPQFLKEEDIDFNNLDENHVYWTSRGWRFGDNSLSTVSNPRPENISSYSVMDTILIRLAENYKNLHRIVVTGHSGGGQVTNRYAATNQMTTYLWDNYQIGLRYIVMNPSSYVYLDDKRVIDGTIDQFEVPSGCSTFNDYGYGLNALFPYALASGVSTIQDQYDDREVIYLLGGNDNDPNSSSLDDSCPANLQGAHRLERGSIYYNHIISFYGESVKTQHFLDTVPSVGHSNQGMFQSNEGRFYLFRKPFIQEPLVADFSSVFVNGCQQNIQFNDASFGNSNEWLWDFGDGTSSDLQNPDHTYAMSGTYLVKLTIMKGGETNSLQREINVQFSELEKPLIEELNGRLITNSDGDSFQWFRNGQSLEGETNRLLSIPPEREVAYTVEVIIGSCNAVSDPFISTVLSTKSLPINENGDLSIFPNPALDWLNIHSTKNYPESTVELRDVGGNIVSIFHKQSLKPDVTLRIPVHQLDTGIYLLTIRTLEASFYGKIVVVK